MVKTVVSSFGALAIGVVSGLLDVRDVAAQAPTQTYEFRVAKKIKRTPVDVAGQKWSCTTAGVCTRQGSGSVASVKACTRYAATLDAEVTYLRLDRELSAAELSQCRDYYLSHKK